VTNTAARPFRLRFRVPLSLIPLVVGVAVAIPLWGRRAEPEFFSAATHVLALGAIGLALQGRFFRLAPHRDAGIGGAYVMLNTLGILAATGLGLFFAFRALAEGKAGPADLAMTSGSLAAGVAAFAVLAMFGTPGGDQDQDEAAA
jgi:hypothetical protein